MHTSRYDNSYPFERTGYQLASGRVLAFYRMPNGALHCEPTSGSVELTHAEWAEYNSNVVRSPIR